MKAAIYARVSTEEQSADKQEYHLLDYAKRQNIEVYKVYKDVISGSKASRPQFNEMLDDMRKNKFSCILVTKLDRIGRSLPHLISMFEEFNKRGIHFIASTQNIDTTTATGRLQLHILSAFAEFERALISERTKEGLKRCSGVGKRGKDKNPRKRRGGAKNTLFSVQNK